MLRSQNKPPPPPPTELDADQNRLDAAEDADDADFLEAELRHLLGDDGEDELQEGEASMEDDVFEGLFELWEGCAENNVLDAEGVPSPLRPEAAPGEPQHQSGVGAVGAISDSGSSSSSTSSSSSSSDVSSDDNDTGHQDTSAASSSQAGPRRPLEQELARQPADCEYHLEGGVGRLVYYASTSRFVAECKIHDKCAKTRSSTGSDRRNAKAQGRPLGHLAAWLETAGRFPDKKSHFDFRPSLEARSSARERLTRQSDSEQLRGAERQPREGGRSGTPRFGLSSDTQPIDSGHTQTQHGF